MPKITGDARSSILDAAFSLFSEKGFPETSMRDIADAVGVKAASLYNHFSGKQALFSALIERETGYVEARLKRAGAMASPDEDPAAYSRLEGEKLGDLVWNSYLPFFDDERVKKLMRMLAESRYRDEKCQTLYESVFVERPIAIQSAIFECLVAEGRFSPCDVKLAAAQFHGPMLMLMERQIEPSEAKEFCRIHTEAFNAAHRKEP